MELREEKIICKIIGLKKIKQISEDGCLKMKWCLFGFIPIFSINRQKKLEINH